MKIGILVTEFRSDYVGGLEMQTRRIAEELAKRGHEITVIARDVDDLNENYSTVQFSHHNIPWVRFILYSNAALDAIEKVKDEIDVLLCMQLTPNGYVGIKAKKEFGIPTVAWVRGGDWYFAKDQFFGRKIISKVINESDAIFAQTSGIKKEILAAYPDANVKVVPNGVDIDERNH